MFIDTKIILLENIYTHSYGAKVAGKWTNISNKCTTGEIYPPTAHTDNWWGTWHISVTASHQR